MHVDIRPAYRPRILFLINEDRYFVSHRMDLARAARDAGCRVTVATRITEYGQTIRDEGFEIVNIRLWRGLHGPLRELAAFLDLVKMYRRLSPDLVHSFTMKHVIYGSVAARLAGIPLVVNSVTGVGSMFNALRRPVPVLKTVAMSVLRAVLRRPGTRTIFQNPEDREQFVAAGLVAREAALLIRGSGEGLPKVLLEGAAAGRPLVASDINGCREIVRDGENGVLVPVKDVKALARAIGKLVEDRALREKMGAAGRRIVAEHFSVEQVARETLEAYRALLRGRWPRGASGPMSS